MSVRTQAGAVAVAVLALVPLADAQIPGLNAGTVTAKIDGAAFSANVSLAMVDDEGKLVLTSLSNQVQIQVPGAKVGKFEIELDDDGGLVGIIVGLKSRDRYIAPVSGSVTIESLSAAAASGRFEFDGKDLATEAPVKVTDGRFQVKLVGSR